jgi:Na+/glutamate symporter
MTNASSAYLGIVIGAIIGGIISWLIYSRQKHTSNKQDHTLKQIKAINDHQETMLKRLDDSDKRHDRVLNTILELNKRIDTIVEGQQRMFESIRPDKEP